MIKPIALYLPQYHVIPENNEWWGNGFTEWTNVKKAVPRFQGHYQPHIPLGKKYYDLSDPNVMIEQTKLAKKYGIYGFCFYHYWFNGKLLLEKPLHNMLGNSEIDFPFCLCWANENWTRRWDGTEKKILIKQEYHWEDDISHIQYLMQFFKDPRYIRIDNKPVFLLYRAELHPNIKVVSEMWNEEARKNGFEGLYLIAMENFTRNVDPQEYGFNAAMEFAPDATLKGKKIYKRNILKYRFGKFLHSTGIIKNKIYENGIYDYITLKNNIISRTRRNYTYFRCVCPSWDNSARREKNAILFTGSSPQAFGEWMKAMVNYSRENLPRDNQFIFINAWNEWGEGCHLEPDEKWGFQYLEAVRDALR